MADLAWRRARAFAPVLVVASVVLLAALAYNLRNLDPGSEELPPPPATGDGPEVVAQEGAGAGLRLFFSLAISVLFLSVVVGAIILYARGVKVWQLLSPWELLGYVAAIAFVAIAILWWDSIAGGVENFVAWATGTQDPGDVGGGESGVGGATELPLGGRPSSVFLIVVVGVLTLHILVLASRFLPRLYRVVTYDAPDPRRSKRELARAVRTAIRDLEAGEDFRTAVLRCYKTMVLLFETRGMRQEPHQTAREWEARALAGMGVSPEGVEDLTSLFEEARYSAHAIGEAQRDGAIASLAAVRAQLEGAA